MMPGSHIVVAVLLGSLVMRGGQDAPRDAAIARAKAAVAQEVSVSSALVELVEAVETEWRDSSLGCPARGMVYAPALTAGYKITLTVGSERFVVHATSGRAVVCGRPRPASRDARDAKLPASDPLVGLRLAEHARVDLAARLGVGNDRVTVSFFRPIMWPDPSLGCPVAGQVYPERPTRGYLIGLASGDQAYEYHSDMVRVVTCSDAVKTADPAIPG